MKPTPQPRHRRAFLFSALAGAVLAASVGVALAWSPTPVKDDPLVRMPGTQPAPEGNVSLEAPNRCLNCHAGYNTSVEPGFNWKGSMMAQSARDFLFFSCLTVAAQDSIWALGNPNATDICIRCHSPGGWMGGNSDPTNASALTGADFDGVQCDFCHRMYDPFFESTQSGAREGSTFWDETNASATPSDAAALETRNADEVEAQTVQRFDGQPFYGADKNPASPTWDEAGSGQFFVSSDAAKRASFADADARHQMLYSRFHKSKFFCATCHDVSNPILANLLLEQPQDGSLPSEANPAYSFFHVERTFSEFMLSDYGIGAGSEGLGPFAPDVFETSNPGNVINKCQDCHMRDVLGAGADKRGAVVRPTDSVEHPESGQPLHDLTGGNAWVSWVLASTDPASSNYDSTNAQLLGQGPAALTLDLTQGQGIDGPALLAGSERAKQQLELAASIDGLSYDSATGALSFRVQNQSGHKLISGFPEGRRMFLNVKAYAGGQLVYEANPYDAAAGTLKGLSYSYADVDGAPLPVPLALGPNEAYVDELVYEMHPSSTLTGEDETFHFALADGRYKDNRIPPKGFRIAQAAGRISVPVWHGVEDPAFYTPSEYAGGYDDVSLGIPAGADAVEVNLYYQTTSREYIEFLRDEIRGTATTLPGPGAGGDSAYLVQTDPFFAQLKAWGDTIWQLWKHNMNVPGAAPYLMAQATVGSTGSGCNAPTPTLLSASGSHQQVAISWGDEHSADGSVAGYNVYYDQAAKGQWVAQVGLASSYTDTGLTNGQQYCYKVTSRYADCESDFSNVLCAIPSNQAAEAGVDSITTGTLTGKGKNKTFVVTSVFARGDAIIIQSQVTTGGFPVAGAVVDFALSGPESTTLTTGPSDASGIAEVTWQTQSPNKRGAGGTAPGSYTLTVTGVTAAGYAWDGAATSTGFTLE
jgi:hypothetical protein